MNTTQLAHLQDQVIKDIQFESHTAFGVENINPNDIKKLKRNLWVKMAEKFAPCNLVVRNLCILALVDKDYWHYKRRIMNQIYKLKGADLWKEGYSYWLYTKPILQIYADFYEYTSIKMFIEEIDKDFQTTSYRRSDGLLYPAPFGDVRDEPLEQCLQSQDVNLYSRCKSGSGWMMRESINGIVYYNIKPFTVGLNGHCPAENITVKIGDGRPLLRTEKCDWIAFPFYQGYDKKYKNKWDKIRSTLKLIGRD